VPEGWFDATTVMLAGPVVSDFRQNINIRKIRLGSEDIQSMLERERLSPLPDGLRDLEVLTEQRVTGPTGPIFQRIVRCRIGDAPRALRQLQVFITRGEFVLAFTASATEDAFADALPTFRKMVESLRFVL
jgi:hypothetical protein